jgi:hypothetical protein
MIGDWQGGYPRAYRPEETASVMHREILVSVERGFDSLLSVERVKRAGKVED